MNYTIAKARYPKLKPFGDADKDKVPNWMDCRPYNKKKQHIYLSPRWSKNERSAAAYAIPTDKHIYIKDLRSKDVKLVSGVIEHEEQHQALQKLFPGREGIEISKRMDLLTVPPIRVIKNGGETRVTKNAGKLYGPRTAGRATRIMIDKFSKHPDEDKMGYALQKAAISSSEFDPEDEDFKENIELHRQHREAEHSRAKMKATFSKKWEEMEKGNEPDMEKIRGEVEEEYMEEEKAESYDDWKKAEELKLEKNEEN